MTGMTEISKSDRILFGVLDWGMGHITRSIPIIKELLDKGVEVFPAASGRGAHVLKSHFPNLEILNLPPYSVNYFKNPLWLGLVQQLPKINRVIREEHQLAKKWAKIYAFDHIISDNRLGLRSPEVHSIYMTHQLRLKQGGLSNLASRCHAYFYSQFDEIWVPDAPESPLSGSLSNHKNNHLPPIHFVGHPSRFSYAEERLTPDGDIVFLLSGPEPLRTQWEQELIEQAQNLQEHSFHLIRGSQEGPAISPTANVKVDDWLSGEDLENALRSSALIIARSGYSTLLDLVNIPKPLVVFPTPGQGEQLYLAEYLSEKGQVLMADAKHFDIKKLIVEAKKFNGRPPKPSPLKLPIS